jgi:membrane protein DedA with SNARE-associated domain
VADAIAPLVGSSAWLADVSPFGWYLGEEPLTSGWDPGGLALLAIVPVVAAVIALVGFDRRDLGT